ncbi:hypothetical protein [Microbacterium testaceum]|uniref:hypothetical protein n=1 Tax=Microbacterium testaceum TaxID=2033 RepID=UPI002AC67FC1|nr:hypothetical protein [Microbacterium testaceum]MDZ5146342.1 hypothetical protein [Microbacterium testaceum]
MNPVLVAVIPGLIVGLGLALLTLFLAPQTVRAGDALTRLGEASITAYVTPGPLSRWDRVGSWLAQHLPQIKFLAPPTRDLDLLEIPVSQFYASKAKAALFGFFTPLVLTLGTQLITGQPAFLPLALSPLLAAILWFSVDSSVKSRAGKARREFTRFIGVYLQMVAVALLGTTTADSALSEAASVSDSWVFQRIRREYAAADLTRTSKWDAIERLGVQLDIPSMVELGRTMRLSEARVGLRDQLIASADKLRNLVAGAERAEAEKVTKASTVPVFLTLFPVILITILPPIFNLLTY